MNRLAVLLVAISCLTMISVYATEPMPPIPLEVRLTKMEVIVVGLLKVDGKGPDRSVSLHVSHVLKRPDDLKGLEPGTVLKVTPRPAGFSDQDGKGVWSLDIDEKDGELIVSKFEFITYGRDYEKIKSMLDALEVEAKLTTKAAQRAEALKEDLQSFQLQLHYHGPQDKPYYNLTLSVLPVPQLATSRFNQIIQIKKDQAAKIIDFLAENGFLDQATDPRVDGTRSPTAPGYNLRVTAKEVVWHAELGWNLAMLKRLDGFHAVLDGEAKQAMGLLIGRLSGHRRQWEKRSAGNPISPIRSGQTAAAIGSIGPVVVRPAINWTCGACFTI
jgi:hypothetical protein